MGTENNPLSIALVSSGIILILGIYGQNYYFFNDLSRDLDELRQQENDEIIRHFKAIQGIIEKKCVRCDRKQGCLGCIFSHGEMIYHIDECLGMMDLMKYRD